MLRKPVRSMVTVFLKQFIKMSYDHYAQILLICSLSFIFSVISSLLPALRVIKLNPIEILRHE